MSVIRHITIFLLLGLSVIFISLILCYPNVFQVIFQAQHWLHQTIGTTLRDINDSSTQAPLLLILFSFGYGVFHAIGPGHGKFILTGYLTAYRSQLKRSLKLAMLSALMQGVVAIILTTVVIAIFQLPTSFYKLSQLWLERISFILMTVLGFWWLWRTYRQFRASRQHKPTIKQCTPLNRSTNPLGNPLRQPQAFSQTTTSCDCGHQHLPSPTQLAQATDWQSQLMIIFTIGVRPCSGAILVLFFSHLLKLYGYGVLAVIAMSIGTGLTLSGFALLVLFARSRAVRLSRWYLQPHYYQTMATGLKAIFSLLLIYLGLALLYGSTLPISGGRALFG